MKVNISTMRKVNEWLGREPYADFATTADYERAYKAWRESVATDDDARFAKAIETAERHAYIVTKTWSLGSFHLRRGDVVYVKDYPAGPMVTRTRGTVQEALATSDWPSIHEHTISAWNARKKHAADSAEAAHESCVSDANGNSIDFAAAVSIMDDDLREEVAANIAPCTDQEFFDEYSRRHAEKFGEDFAPYVGAAW